MSFEVECNTSNRDRDEVQLKISVKIWNDEMKIADNYRIRCFSNEERGQLRICN